MISASDILQAETIEEVLQLIEAHGLIANDRGPMSAENWQALKAYWPNPISRDAEVFFDKHASCSVRWLGIDLDGGHQSPEEFYDRYVDWGWKRNGWLYVGSDGSGDNYIMQTTPGELCGSIWFIDQSDLDRLTYAVASSFTSWLRMAIASELDPAVDWPCGRDVIQRYDPMLLKLVPSSALCGGA